MLTDITKYKCLDEEIQTKELGALKATGKGWKGYDTDGSTFPLPN